MTEIVSINTIRAIKNNDNTLLSPAECLDEAAREIRSGERNCDKILVLSLDTQDDNYHVGFYASNLKSSEVVALLEAAKLRFLRDMGF